MIRGVALGYDLAGVAFFAYLTRLAWHQTPLVALVTGCIAVYAGCLALRVCTAPGRRVPSATDADCSAVDRGGPRRNRRAPDKARIKNA